MKVKPFKGLRPPKSLVDKVASKPYDVLNSEEARREAEGNEKSLYRITKPEIDFPQGTNEHDPRVYEKPPKIFANFRRMDGWYKTGRNVLCVRSNNERENQYGLVVAASVEDYFTGKIKTRTDTPRQEEDRMKHVRITNANMEPVFLPIQTIRN